MHEDELCRSEDENVLDDEFQKIGHSGNFGDTRTERFGTQPENLSLSSKFRVHNHICSIELNFAQQSELNNMNMFTFLLIAFVARSVGALDSNIIPPKTVDALEPGAYMGRWYLMYTSLLPLSTYAKEAYCATADYLNPISKDGKITFDIQNAFRYDAAKPPI